MFKKDIVSNQSLIRVKGWKSGQCRLCLRLSSNDIPNLYLQQNSNRSYAQQINYWLRIEVNIHTILITLMRDDIYLQFFFAAARPRIPTENNM